MKLPFLHVRKAFSSKKNKEKKDLSEPRFELGISDSIANHITTRP